MNHFINNYEMSLIMSNAFSFLRLPLEFSPYDMDYDWVITGIPFDLATSGHSGSRYGPSAIRQVSTHLAWERCRWPWNFNINDVLKIVDCGDLIFETGNVENLTSKLQFHAEQLLASNKRMLSFGGDHYITLPLLRSYAKFFGKISILHFDAHTDSYVCNNKYDHGTILFHALNEGLIDPVHSVQFGVRTVHHQNHGFTIFNMQQIFKYKIDYMIYNIKKIFADKPVYLTFDIDCLDPSVAPGTGTPVIGGLTTCYVLELLRGLQSLNIIGMDLVEVLPSHDYAQITALAAATLALELLYIQAAKRT
ncbi:agmatinase [Blochmannia endosymbiont of Camponotus (Colobopsis) obliquus]|uniref:agmatinase n=1 Tax=Blochmannia endosymbiont of Camponotus (Colobopsis) obliquus TaxID=1505597 RepID=UPI00061A6CD6|nr:agmatinase [Blochmannia endosymbiont of Camponotus (Colobopsis) obliquus]AKC60417.1 agmatinase [Blochmannia endosymbiont of Camponotus (Colobopsis) obliquus]